MKKVLFILAALCLVPLSLFALHPLIYFGDTLAWNNDWVKRQCGTLITASTLPEISGIACSRVTPGYIWMQSDDYRNVIAADEKGDERYLKISFTGLPSRWDWEDMCGGVYNDTNYLFVGAFGDNNESEGNYYIIYFQEPEIVPSVTTQTIKASYIHFQYPEGKKHNCEAMMYDNREQMLYVITKVYYDVCQVFKMPFRLDYNPADTITMEYVCDLGVKSDLGSGSKPDKGFHLVTAADISPDSKYILIKNQNNTNSSYCWVLLWERLEGESVAETLIRERHPQPLRCYNVAEWQGEAICWLDSTTFYTTSDEDEGDPPIYKYTRKDTQSIENVTDKGKEANRLVLKDNMLYVRSKDGLYALDGRKCE